MEKNKNVAVSTQLTFLVADNQQKNVSELFPETFCFHNKCCLYDQMGKQ